MGYAVKLQNSAPAEFQLQYITRIGSTNYNSYTYSFNVSSYIPDIYMNCTADDFYVTPYGWYGYWYANSSAYTSSGVMFSKSYNSSTGVLSGQSGGNLWPKNTGHVTFAITLDLYVIRHGQ